MFTIDQQDMVLETSSGTLVAEASTLGFKPGQWPIFIRYNGFTLALGKVDNNNDGDLAGIFYNSEDGEVSLLVIND